MPQTDLTVSIDKDLKESGEALFRSLGVNWSTAVSAFVAYSIRIGKIPEMNETEPDGFVYSKELEEQDAYFDRREQAELYRRIKDGETRGQAAFTKWDPIVDGTFDHV